MSCVLLTRSTANEWKRLWQGKKASFENTWNTWRRLASWQRRKLSRFGKVKEWWNLRAMWSRSRSGAGGTTEEFLGFCSQSVIYRFRLLECSDLWIWTNDWDLKSEARWRYFWNLLGSFLAFDSSTWRPLNSPSNLIWTRRSQHHQSGLTARTAGPSCICQPSKLWGRKLQTLMGRSRKNLSRAELN